MNYTPEEQDIIVLSSFTDLSYGDKKTALCAFRVDSTRPSDTSAAENLLIKRLGVGVYNKVKEKFFSQTYRERVFSYISSFGAECMTCVSPDYPELLKKIPTPPAVLFCKGNRELLKGVRLAIVGSRVTAPKMLEVCKKFSSELSQKFTLVTGSATGADSAVLMGSECRAVSVLAIGFGRIKSQSNSALLEKVSQSGLLVTENYPSVAARSYSFPIRNRIIAGLSSGTLIVSAGKKSGALITAGMARKFGRKVFSIPYSLGVSSGEGCNRLIKNGARVVLETGDIFSAFGMESPVGAPRVTPAEERILSIISESGEASVAQIAARLNVQPFTLIPDLTSLEIKKFIVRVGGNRYSKL